MYDLYYKSGWKIWVKTKIQAWFRVASSAKICQLWSDDHRRGWMHACERKTRGSIPNCKCGLEFHTGRYVASKQKNKYYYYLSYSKKGLILTLTRYRKPENGKSLANLDKILLLEGPIFTLALLV
jgi:hypothetical protein